MREQTRIKVLYLNSLICILQCLYPLSILYVIMDRNFDWYKVGNMIARDYYELNLVAMAEFLTGVRFKVQLLLLRIVEIA
jgi:hypothetical protein